MGKKHNHWRANPAAFVVVAAIAGVPLTVKADGGIPVSPSLSRPAIVVSQTDNTLLLASGARVNLHALELPLLRDAGESALRRTFFRREVAGKKITLDGSAFKAMKLERNRYGDYLGVVQLGDKWLQQYLLGRGWARLNGVYPYPETLLPALRAAEKFARRQRLGLWQESQYALLHADELAIADRRFHLVEGRVVKVVRTRRMTYVNFGDDWRRDFTAAIQNGHRRHFRKLGISLQDLTGRKIRLRGWIRPYNGPFMELQSWTQVELLEP